MSDLINKKDDSKYEYIYFGVTENDIHSYIRNKVIRNDVAKQYNNDHPIKISDTTHSLYYSKRVGIKNTENIFLEICQSLGKKICLNKQLKSNKSANKKRCALYHFN